MKMKKDIYGVALIGCGAMGAAHLENIYCKDNVSIKYVCDTDIERAKEFSKKFSAQNITTYADEVIASEDVDIVIIATPPSSHLDLLTKSIENKKHVICEKPISDNIEDSKKAISYIKAHPECKVLIGYILRHNKTYQKVAKMIQDGAIGTPIVMRMAQNHHTMNWQKYLNLICETSPIVDCGVHYVDVMRWFTGEEVVCINGIGSKTEADVPDGKYNYGLISAKLSGGSVAYYEAGWSNTISADNLKEFFGPKGKIRIVQREARQNHQEEGDLIEYYKYPEKTYEMININCKRKPTDAQLDALIDMIENDAVPCQSMDDVLKSTEIVFKADEIIKQTLS